MTLVLMLKRTAKVFLLDYFQSMVTNAFRLLAFRARFKIKTILFPARYKKSSLPIDIVIPVVDKDVETLPFAIDSARRYIGHPIMDVYLVCPENSVLVKRIGLEKNCKIVNERDLVDISPKDIHFVWQGHNRAGWMYQQFLKWSGGQFCTQTHYLVMDSDTVFIRPQVFEIGGRMVFDYCDEYHVPYFQAFEKIFGIKPQSPMSFTSHHALIDTIIMSRLKSDIEAFHRKPWYEVILSVIDQNEMACISDYDNYGQYILEKLPSMMCVRYWHNKRLSRESLGDFEKSTRKYARRYNTISFHSEKW